MPIATIAERGVRVSISSTESPACAVTVLESKADSINVRRSCDMELERHQLRAHTFGHAVDGAPVADHGNARDHRQRLPPCVPPAVVDECQALVIPNDVATDRFDAHLFKPWDEASDV